MPMRMAASGPGRTDDDRNEDGTSDLAVTARKGSTGPRARPRARMGYHPPRAVAGRELDADHVVRRERPRRAEREAVRAEVSRLGGCADILRKRDEANPDFRRETLHAALLAGIARFT